jgi:sterol desaturase/sphingolipid hydroxylase (fatty acid hydroxylase superfamily)
MPIFEDKGMSDTGTVSSEQQNLNVHKLRNSVSKFPLLRQAFVALTFFYCLYLIAFETSGSRTYWAYLVYSYVAMGLFYLYLRQKKKVPRSELFKTQFFSKDIWFHRSAIHDYLIIIINFYIILEGGFHGWGIGPDLLHGATQSFLSQVSAAAVGGEPGLWVIALYTVASFALGDLSYYISHRISHEVPCLWEFHKVHHSAQVLTPATVYRAHPVDMFWNVTCRSVGVGLASGVFYFYYPTIESVITIAGVNAGVFIAYMTFANLRHSHIWLSFGKTIEHFMVSPAQHHIHHSKEPRHFDKNYGSFFALWDWWFGSLYIPEGKWDGLDKISYGLGSDEDEEKLNTVWKLYVNPLKGFGEIVFGSSKSQSSSIDS